MTDLVAYFAEHAIHLRSPEEHGSDVAGEGRLEWQCGGYLDVNPNVGEETLFTMPLAEQFMTQWADAYMPKGYRYHETHQKVRELNWSRMAVADLVKLQVQLASAAQPLDEQTAGEVLDAVERAVLSGIVGSMGPIRREFFTPAMAILDAEFPPGAQERRDSLRRRYERVIELHELGKQGTSQTDSRYSGMYFDEHLTYSPPWLAGIPRRRQD
jgi:hypothetical protein